MNVCQERDLYATINPDGSKDQAIEETVTSSKIDGPAGNALKTMMDTGGDISGEDRLAWTRFLVAQRLRTPDVLREARESVRQIVMEELSEAQAEYQQLRQDRDPADLYDFVIEKYDPFIRNTGLRVLLKALMNDEILQTIYDMIWGIRFINPKDIELEYLMCDRPLVIEGDLRNDNSALYIPISPKALFFAVKTREQAKKVKKFSGRNFVHRVNKKLLNQTDRFVIGQTEANNAIIKKYFLQKTKIR